MPFRIQCLVLAGLAAAAPAVGQKDALRNAGGLRKQTFFDLRIGPELANGGGAVSIGATTYFRPQLGLALALHGLVFNAVNTPSDYNAHSLHLFGGTSNPKPNDFLGTLCISAVWRQPLTVAARPSWLSLHAGPACGLYSETVFTYNTSPGLFSPNYWKTEQSRHLLGVELGADVLFPVGRASGLGFGVWGHFNGPANVICLELVAQIGKKSR